MYKGASDGKQRALHQGRPADWVNGSEKTTLMQEYEAMRRRDVQLDGQIRLFPVGSDERQRLGKERAELQARLKEIKEAVKAEGFILKRERLADYFMKAAKDIIVPGQYKAILKAAQRMQDEDKRVASADEQTQNAFS